MTEDVQIEDTPTYEKVWKMFQETDKKFQKIAMDFEEMRLMSQENDRVRKESEQLRKENDIRIKDLGEQIGGLHNKFGKYNEGLFMPSLIRILGEKFNCFEHTVNYSFKNNGDPNEIDLLGASDEYDIIVEIKSNLRKEDIEKTIKKIDSFKKYSRLYRGYPIIGIITATSYTEKERKLVIENGFYFISTNDDIAKLKTPENFEPKMW